MVLEVQSMLDQHHGSDGRKVSRLSCLQSMAAIVNISEYQFVKDYCCKPNPNDFRRRDCGFKSLKQVIDVRVVGEHNVTTCEGHHLSSSVRYALIAPHVHLIILESHQAPKFFFKINLKKNRYFDSP